MKAGGVLRVRWCPDGLQDDAGHDAGVGDHGQVRGVHFGDTGVRVLVHGQLERQRMTWSARLIETAAEAALATNQTGALSPDDAGVLARAITSRS
jgi:hypothetical protein